jgi:hypothetical protein
MNQTAFVVPWALLSSNESGCALPNLRFASSDPPCSTLEEPAKKANKHFTSGGGPERGDRNLTLQVLHAVAIA